MAAQSQTATVRVQVRAAQKPIEGAEVVVAGTSHRTDATGTTTVVTDAGNVDITVVKAGFVPVTTSVQVGVGATQEVIVELEQRPNLEESVTVVASTRTDKRLEDQPMRVEVLAREEIEEKMLMTPGDIVMMLNEMGGMRVQTTSPSLGAASVRIQGMRGRYTRVLSDGLPLFRRGRRARSASDSADGSGTGRGHQRCSVGVIWRRCDGWRHQPAVAAAWR